MTGPRDAPVFTPAELERAILSGVDARGAGKTICPSEIARTLAGSDEKAWRQLMKPIRAAAVGLAETGRVQILRKGRVVDPAAFKGVYRLAAMATDDAGPDDDGFGAGNNASVRPVAK